MFPIYCREVEAFMPPHEAEPLRLVRMTAILFPEASSFLEFDSYFITIINYINNQHPNVSNNSEHQLD